MNFERKKKSIIDVIFIIALFGVFMISALFVLLFGAKIYQNTADDMGSNYSTRTALSYITEKMHQYDHLDGVDVVTTEGTPMLKLIKTINDRDIVTYLYSADGFLREQTLVGDIDFIPANGQEILELKSFKATKVNDSLYRFNIIDAEDKAMEFYISLYCYSDKQNQ